MYFAAQCIKYKTIDKFTKYQGFINSSNIDEYLIFSRNLSETLQNMKSAENTTMKIGKYHLAVL